MRVQANRIAAYQTVVRQNLTAPKAASADRRRRMSDCQEIRCGQYRVMSRDGYQHVTRLLLDTLTRMGAVSGVEVPPPNT